MFIVLYRQHYRRTLLLNKTVEEKLILIQLAVAEVMTNEYYEDHNYKDFGHKEQSNF